ncbi:Arm DNA-binding domain-containing protein [Desulfopila aestuarii]|uniref:Uncharacterized protein n=1 Tax=Desulfopila aestuarii DSM 18488 TaxID=1121416 RepID=A0A1M7YK41_9BACT|nr:Arm DNA-binding domain-containing protein [Desulfopila aestuarii]SHO53001.1 hypothetical protein SAMN02745220_04881 [Desulfopila aestuarii DSM 18488]
MPNITNRLLQSVRLDSTPYFIRDDKVKGFGAKVNPSGAVSLIAEIRHEGRTVRKTLGTYPVLSIQDGRVGTIAFIQEVRVGQTKVIEETTLHDEL